MDLESWLIGIFVALGLACIGLIIWAAASGNADCPKGQHSAIVSYMPVLVGKVVVVTPVYGCEAGNG